MLSLPPPLLRLPRALLEHPLPLSGPGISLSISYVSSSAAGAPLSHSLVLGLVDRWQRADSSPSPGFTLDTFSTLCALLTLTERRDGVTLTYNQLFRALTGSRSLCSAHHRESLKSSLSTLELIDSSQTSADSSTPVYERLLRITPTVTSPVFGHPAPAFIVHFSPRFLAALDDPRSSTLFHFHAFRTLRSRLSRALYPILSTWAHYNRATSSHPFRITLSRLITHLGSAPPRYLSQRRAFFFGHRKSNILSPLHNLPTPHGFLQLSLTSATSVDDDCLNVWFSPVATSDVELRASPSNSHLRDSSPKNPEMVELEIQKNISPADRAFAPQTAIGIPGSKGRQAFGRELEGQRPSTDPLSPFRHLKIYQAWNTSGRSDTDFVSRVRTTAVTLSQDDLALLHAAKISPSRCESFLLLSKKLLPQRTWLDLLGEAKYAALSTTPPTNPTGKLISEILTSVRSAI